MFKFRHLTCKVGNMRKEKQFTVCPVSDQEPHLITIQSDNRIARVNTQTKKIVVSNGKGGHQGFLNLNPMMGAKEYDCPAVVLEQLTALEEDHGPMESGPVALTQGGRMAPTVVARRSTGADL